MPQGFQNVDGLPNLKGRKFESVGISGPKLPPDLLQRELELVDLFLGGRPMGIAHPSRPNISVGLQCSAKKFVRRAIPVNLPRHWAASAHLGGEHKEDGNANEALDRGYLFNCLLKFLTLLAVDDPTTDASI